MRDTTTEKHEQKLGDRKLKLAGYSYILGDAAMYAAAAARGEKLAGNKLGAISWGIGGLAAARYGNPSAERQLAIQARALEKHLAQQGITIPADVRAQNALLHSPGLWERVEDFLYQHPSEILNLGYAVGAVSLLSDASKKLGKSASILPFGKHTLSSEFWIGTTVLIGALGGLFIKEDPHAKEHSSGLWASIKEKPLRFSSFFYTLNNAFLAHRVYSDFSQRGNYGPGDFKPHYASALQLGAYLFGNAMLHFSSRGQINAQANPEHIAQLEDAAARILAAQPPQVQQAMLADVSQFMASQPGVKLPAPEIAQALATRLTQLTGERVQMAANQVSWTEREKHRLAQKDVAQDAAAEPARG